MKKFVMIAFVAAATLFTACNSKTDGAATTDADTTKVETTEVEAVATEGTGNAALDKYTEFVNKYIELQDKIKGGDVAAAQELQKLGEELAATTTQMQGEFEKMTPAQAEKYKELAEKLQKAAMAN
ncbi:MAG: hypothetical protein E6772_01920 [Dysgonomonas sp.]|nr:hypothetical protein [Dysgonomonas sp.]